jgi:hypothetical protein
MSSSPAVEGLLCGIPVHWATLAEGRDAWVARVEHFEALRKQYSAANATVASRHITDVLEHAQKVLLAIGDVAHPAIKMILVDQYNVAWLEYLTRTLR